MAKDVGTSRADLLWPKSPVQVSPVEGIIEAFWNPDLKDRDRWLCDSGALTHYWDACFYNVQIGASGGVGALSRAYSLPIEDYERLRVRLRPGMGVKTTIIAEVDGSQQTVAQYVA